MGENIHSLKDLFFNPHFAEIFDSEIGIKKLMLEKGMINRKEYLVNYIQRFIIQLLLPNSVRGWGVRGLGPGRFSGSDGRIDFIRQTGDLKLDLSAEWRTHLFWKIDGAAFVDAGNIWTLRDYEEQPEGQFRFDTFWKQIAVAYGLGVRLNFGYFIMRLDGGMKAINPAYESGPDRYPVIHPRFGRDFQLHFAVGLPY